MIALICAGSFLPGTYERMFSHWNRCATFASELASRRTNDGVVGQSLGMTSADSSLYSSAFATADAGFEYLATAEHYRYLAKGIVGALHRGCLVLVTGNPPASSPMLAAALREAAPPRTVIELFCGPDLDCETLLAAGSMGPDTPVSAAVAIRTTCRMKRSFGCGVEPRIRTWRDARSMMNTV